MPTRRCRTRTTTASAITESTSPWTMVEPVRSGGQPRTNGWGSSMSRACASKLSMADSPGNRSTTTAVSTSSSPVGRRSAWPSRQRQAHFRTLPHARTTARWTLLPVQAVLASVEGHQRERVRLTGEHLADCFQEANYELFRVRAFDGDLPGPVVGLHLNTGHSGELLHAGRRMVVLLETHSQWRPNRLPVRKRGRAC